MITERPVRVMRIIDRLNVGGPAKHVVWLAAGLEPRGYDTLLVTGRVAAGEGDMGYFAEARGVRPHVMAAMSREISFRDVIVVVKLLRLMWSFRPDVVHTHKSKAGAAGRVAALLYRWLVPSALVGRPRRCAIVHTYHGHTFYGYFGAVKARIFLALERLLARVATDSIVVIGEEQRREIGERFRVGRENQYRVIPLGIDLDEVSATKPALRREMGVEPEAPLVGTVGRLCAIKNQALFIEAAARVVARAPRVRFAIVGDGELRKDLEAQTSRLGLAGRTVFTGFRRDAARLCADFDVMVLTSRNEGTPVTLIEALAAGRPVVSTEVGGVVDLFGELRREADGFRVWEHGLTVPSDDPERLARAIGFLLDEPGLRAEMGARGRAFVRANLSKERLLRDAGNLYAELVGRSPAPVSDAPPALVVSR